MVPAVTSFINSTWGPNVKQSSAQAMKCRRTIQYIQNPTMMMLKKELSSMQYKVTQEDGTEPPFRNEYNDNKKEGIYVDIVTGEPLFASGDKFDSGTGWPSFTQTVGA